MPGSTIETGDGEYPQASQQAEATEEDGDRKPCSSLISVPLPAHF
jgi:hypothetical protein